MFGGLMSSTVKSCMLATVCSRLPIVKGDSCPQQKVTSTLPWLVMVDLTAKSEGIKQF